MRLISLFITIIVFYNPIFGLWSYLINQMVKLRLTLFGIQLVFAVPNTGILLLFFYGLLFWVAISELLLFLEPKLKLDVLRKFGLRNGMLYATKPFLTLKLPFFLSKGILSILLLKGLFVFLFDFIGKLLISLVTGFLSDRLSIISNLLNTVLGFVREYSKTDIEYILLALCLTIVITERFISKEKDDRIDADIEHVGVCHRRNQTEIEIPATQDIE